MQKLIYIKRRMAFINSKTNESLFPSCSQVIPKYIIYSNNLPIILNETPMGVVLSGTKCNMERV